MIPSELREEIQELAERNIARDARHDDTPDELSREIVRLAVCMCKLAESLADSETAQGITISYGDVSPMSLGGKAEIHPVCEP